MISALVGGAGLLLACGMACAQDSSFDWNQRWQHYLHRTYSPERLGWLAIDTGIDQVLGEPRKWGREPGSYARRYASGMGKRIVRNSIELGVGAALREDIRYRNSGQHGLGSRLRFAAIQSVSAYRGDERVFSWSRLASTMGGPLVISRWYPGPMTTHRFFECVSSAYFGHLQNSLLAEFEGDMRAVGRRTWRRLRGR